MAYQFKSATVYYGVAEYPMNLIESNPEFKVIDFLPEMESMTGATLIAAIASCIGAIGFDEVKARIRTYKVVAEVSIPEHNIYMPETIQIIGNGFSVIWTKV